MKTTMKTTMKTKLRLFTLLLSLLLVGSSLILVPMADSGEDTTDVANTDFGKTVYSNHFDSYTEVGTDNLLSELGWTNFFSNTNASFTAAGDGKLLCKPAGWSATEVVSSEAMKGVSQYTVSMDIKLSSVTNFFGLIYNWDAKNGTSWPKNCGNVQLRPGYNDSQKEDYVVRNGAKTNGSDVSLGASLDTSFGKITDLQNSVLNFAVEVDAELGICRVYIDGVLVSTFENSEKFSKNESSVCILAQGCEVEIDNLWVTKGCLYHDIALVGEGHQRSVVASESYDLRFISSIKSIENVASIAIRVTVNVTDGVSKTFDRPSTTVYTSVTGTVDGVPIEYKASEYEASYLYCLAICEIPLNLGTITYTATPCIVLESGQTLCFESFTVVYNGSTLVE